MPAEFFVDTSGWFPALVENDPAHAKVSAAIRKLIAKRRHPVTTNLVVAETHALLLRRRGRAAGLSFVRLVTEPPTVIVRSTPEVEAKAQREWLERYDDQDFSFTDAVSFAVMSERRIVEALTLDGHFAAAGFNLVIA